MRRFPRPSPLNLLKRYLPKNADDASALVLTLLVIVLLSAIVTSFLSSTRTEQIATSNYTSKVKAEMFATTATQQAMAKIQLGFNTTNATTVITTQPGAIRQFVFSSGTISSNSTQELFSGTGNVTTNGTANLNNLESPSSNSSATSNQWTITGNASEQINVPLENITSNGTVVGRIAYYVDDEGTKLNVNAATGNRTALNVGTRPQDIASLISATQAANFSNIVNNSTTNNSSITGWSYFFRPEQVSAAIAGFSGNNTPLLSTATTSASSTANMTHLLTPWGTQRIPINTLSTNATDGTGDASVRSIFEALTGLNATSVNGTYTASNSTYGNTGQGLQNIFGGNFSTKYTPVGVKQIAANMLQMRDPNTATVNASFSYQGPLIGSASLNSSTHIPEEYLGFAPYPVVSEVSFDVIYQNWPVDPPLPSPTARLRINVIANVEIYNPYPANFNAPDATLEYFIRGLTWNMTYTNISTNQTYTHRYGGYGNWTDSISSREYFKNFSLRNAPGKFSETNFLSNNPYGVKGLNIPAYSKKKYNFTAVGWGSYGQVNIGNTGNIRITSISDVECAITYVKIVANSSIALGRNGAANINPNTVRDWVLGADVDRFIPNNGTFSVRAVNPVNFPVMANVASGTGVNVHPNPISTYSYQRLCPLIKTSMAASSNLTASTRSWTANASTANQTFGNVTSGSNLNPPAITTANQTELLNDANANPNYDSGNTIPSDPSYNNSNGNAVYASNNASDMREPYLVTGNYTSPADLGLVPTNQRWRRLRMQMQPASEGALIPDWAMLDVISFGNSTNSTNPLTRLSPVNLNGRFYLPGNVTLAPRTIGIQALAKVLENSSADKIQDPMNPANSPPTDATRFWGNNTTVNATMVVNNIRNMSWSTSSTWGNRRSNKNFPTDQYILPSEIMEIAGVANEVDQTNYNNSASHFKWNEGRASALIPAVTTRSSLFTIYAYAQAGKEINGTFVPDSEALTKTLVEVQSDTSTTPTTYKVKKLYTQPISMGE